MSNCSSHENLNNNTTTSSSRLVVPLLRDLEATVLTQPAEHMFATFYEADGKPTESLTFKAIWEQAGVVSYHLRVT